MSTLIKYLLGAYYCLCFHAYFVCPQTNRAKITQNLIRSIIVNEDGFSSIWLKNCQSKSDNLNFLKTTNRSFKLLQNALDVDVNWMERCDRHNFWFVVDLSCKASIDFVLKTNQTYFGHPFRWILIDGHVGIYENLHLLPDSNVIIAEFDEGTKGYILRQGTILSFSHKNENKKNRYKSSSDQNIVVAYRISVEKQLIYEEYGSWSIGSGINDVRPTRIISQRRRNLQGHQLVAAGVWMNPESVNRDLDDYK